MRPNTTKINDRRRHQHDRINMEGSCYGDMKVNELKSELKKRGAKVSGTKETLVQRLQDYDRNNNFIYFVNDIPQDDLTFSVDWPESDLYISVDLKTLTPELDIVCINTYFLETYKDNAGLTEYAAVHRKGYNMMLNKYIVSLLTVSSNGYMFFKGQVHSENSKSLTYFVNIAFQNCGGCIMVQSMCECVSGKGPKAVCKHVACVSYAILRFREHHEWSLRKTPTESRQIWHEPKKVKFNSPKKAEDLTFEVQEYNVTKRKRSNMCYDPRPETTCSDEEWNNSVRSKVINYCSMRGKRLGINGVMQVACFKSLINDHDYLKEPLHFQYILNRITVTAEEADSIERQTRFQSQSKLWHNERSVRVTASHVGDISKFTEKRNQAKYAEDIVFKRVFTNPALEWGKTNEARAIESYEAMSYNKVKQCGLFICQKYPFIGASPDGLIGELTTLEVKCPFSIKDDFITAENYTHLEVIHNQLCLKESSSYYLQIQAQLLATNRQYSDFFVWTNKDEKRIQVERNDKIINDLIIPKVKNFYFTHMLPVIARKMYGSKLY